MKLPNEFTTFFNLKKSIELVLVQFIEQNHSPWIYFAIESFMMLSRESRLSYVFNLSVQRHYYYSMNQM